MNKIDINEYSSKIKSVFIQLYNYSFFHSPTEINESDDRFIGRKEIIDKLKNILIDSETKSGVYLVTGHRGIGKSSLVSKAINDLHLNNKIKYYLGRIFRIFCISIILFIIHSLKNINLENLAIGDIYFIVFEIIFIIFIILYLCFFSENSIKLNLKNNYFFKKILVNSITKFFEIIQIKYEKKPSSRAYIILKDFLIGFLILFCFPLYLIFTNSSVIYSFNNLSDFYYNFFILSFLYLLIYFLITLKHNKNKQHYNKVQEKIIVRIKKCFRFTFSIFQMFLLHLSLSNRIYIKVNLGHDELTPLEVFKSISKNLKSKFISHYRSFKLLNISSKLFYMICIYFITGSFFYQKNIYGLNNSFKKNFNLTKYFPSQEPLILESSLNIERSLFEKAKVSNNKNIPLRVANLKSILENEIIYIKKYKSYYDSLSRLLNNLKFKNNNIITILINNNGMRYQKNEVYNIKESQSDLLYPFEYSSKINFGKSINQDSKLHNFIKDKVSSILTNIKFPEENQNLLNKIDTYYSNKIIINNVDSLLSDINQFKNFNICNLYIFDDFIKGIHDSNIISSDVNVDSSSKTFIFYYVDFFVSQSYYQIFHDILYNFTQDLIPFNLLYLIPNDIFRLRKDSHFCIIPFHIDYLFIFYFAFIWFLTRIIITKTNLLKQYNRHYILKKLNFIDDMIDSEMTISKSSEKGIADFLKMKILKGSSKRYPKADVRDIETSLIEILDDIERIPAIIRPEFVFIFDELDKIEPNKNNNSSDIENKIQNEIILERSIAMTPEGVRQHQQAVFDLLSSMKYFLTTAKSKFLFIAGREFYDAYLADIAGNKNSIDSIFHDRININSFYSDSTYMKLSDITSMTETYVCKYLFPIYYHVEEYSLKSFNHYLIKEYNELFNENHPKNNCLELKYIAKQKREKIIITLKQFITYLTHVSNGSPKKITSYFEKNIIKFDSALEKEHILCDNLNVGSNQNNYFLKFDSPKQYTLGMYYFLLNPIIQSINNRVKEYDDKLLISSSFLINHLFKFHSDGFSWRNLELAPEIIDINRTPGLRSFIKNIINFLSQTHIREIVSGLFTFKFTKKISFEIAYLSKISEDASAAFNFTLDESLPVKKQHEKLLLELIKKYNLSNLSKKNEYIHSISAIQVILGDLKFYDEDYTSAILDYIDSIQKLRYSKIKNFSESKMILFIRTMLKLGFAFEKRNTYTSAYITYGELSSIVVKYRDIKLEDYGLSEYRKRNISVNNENMRIIARHNSDEIKQNYYKEMEPSFIDEKGNEAIRLTEFDISQFFSKMRENFTPLKENLFLKITSFEGIRLMYQPLIAKFQMIEKSNLGGITLEDIYRLEAEFSFLTKAIKKEEKYLILSEFWNKAGDILYYKNGFPSEEKVNNCLTRELSNNINICIDGNRCDDYREDLKDTQTYSIKVPCLACYIYNKSLVNFVEFFITANMRKSDNLNRNKREYIFEIIDAIDKNHFVNNQDYSIKALASILSDIGNVYLNCSLKMDITYDNFKTFLHYMSNGNENIKTELIATLKSRDLNQLEKSFWYFYGSAILYKKANEFKDYSFQLSKIIYTLREYLLVGNEKNTEIRKCLIKKILLHKDNNVSIIENFIVKKAIKSIYAAYDHIHRFEINNLKKTLFNEDNKIENQNISLNKISINTDLDEINFTYLDLLIKCGIYSPRESFKKIVISPYSIESSIYNRIMKLKFKAFQNFAIFKEILPIQKLKSEKNNDKWNFFIWSFLFLSLFDCNKKCFFDEMKKSEKEKMINDLKHILPIFNIKNNNLDVNSIIRQIKKYFDNTNIIVLKRQLNMEISTLQILSFLITDSIYCLSEIIRLSNVYGVSYVLNYSYLGFVHYRLMQWRQYYKYLEQFLGIVKNFENVVKNNDSYNIYFKNDNSLNNIQDDFRKFITFIIKYKFNTIIENKIDIKGDLVNLVGVEDLFFISENYLSEKTINCFYSAIETHSEGAAYKKFISKMYYLNDDFNDDLFHFSAATERYRILNSKLMITKGLLKDKNSQSNIYNFDNYFTTAINNDQEQR